MILDLGIKIKVQILLWVRQRFRYYYGSDKGSDIIMGQTKVQILLWVRQRFKYYYGSDKGSDIIMGQIKVQILLW